MPALEPVPFTLRVPDRDSLSLDRARAVTYRIDGMLNSSTESQPRGPMAAAINNASTAAELAES